jgi:hypothetical protein
VKRVTLLFVAALFLSGCRSEPQPDVLSADEACELLIDHAIQDSIGLWAIRYSVIVWCKGGEITATVATANNQQTLPRGVTDAPEEIRSIARKAIDRVLERRNWTTRYPKVTVQFFP